MSNPLSKKLMTEWHPTKNKALKPEQVTAGSHKKAWWICNEGHEWQAAVKSRAIGQGCPYCAGRRVWIGYNDLATINPTLTKEWHPTKNEDLKPDRVTAGSKKKVWWICDKGHEWQAAIASRTVGWGCPYCAGKRVWIGYNDLTTINPTLAKEWHPTKNEDLEPEQVTIGSHKKAWWICNKGHEWQAAVKSRAIGQGCPYCAGRRVWIGYNDLATINPALAKEWHPTKNANLTPYNVTRNSGRKAWWICNHGHEWQAVIASRIEGSGCPYCAGKKILKGFNDLATVNPILAQEWHPIKNDQLTAADVTQYTGKRVWWLCHKGHEWQALISNRANGAGCPICKREHHTSFAEQAIYYYISKFFKAFNRYSFHKKEIDIFIPSLAIGIEHDGWFHREYNAQIREKKKNVFLNQDDITLIRVKTHTQYAVDETSGIIYYQYHQTNYSELEKAIKQIFRFLTKITGQEYNPNINIDRDKNKIYLQCRTQEKVHSLFSNNPEAKKYWDFEKNKEIDPNYVPPKTLRKAWWRCEKGHEWEMEISEFSVGRRCPYCAGRRVWIGYNDLATVNPMLAKEWHPVKNGMLTPLNITANSHKKIWWQCKKGHEWQAKPNSRSHGNSCPYCSNRKILKGYNDLQTTHPYIARQWHPTKNEALKPDQVTAGSNKKVWWTCDKGHEWQAVIAKRTKGSGCLLCYKQDTTNPNTSPKK